MACPDWLLIAVECGGVGSGVAKEAMTPWAEQVAGSQFHLIHCHVTRVGNLSLRERYKLWIPSIKTKTFRDQNLQREIKSVTVVWHAATDQQPIDASSPLPLDCQLILVSQWTVPRAEMEPWAWCRLCTVAVLREKRGIILQCSDLSVTSVFHLKLLILPTWCSHRATVPGWSGCCTCHTDT